VAYQARNGREDEAPVVCHLQARHCRGYRTDNPLDVASAAIPNRRGDAQRSRRQAALPHQQVSNALAIAHDTNAWTGTKLAFRFLVLTAARSGEVRGAIWDESTWQTTSGPSHGHA